MKKIFILLACAAVLLSLAALLSLAFSPVQTKIASRMLARHFAGAGLESLSVGMGSLSLRGLKLPMAAGAEISIGHLEAKLSFLSLVSKRVEIESLILENSSVRLARKQVSAAAQTQIPAGGSALEPGQNAAGKSRPAAKPSGGGENLKEASKAAERNSEPANSGSALAALREWSFKVSHARADLRIEDGESQPLELKAELANAKCAKNFALRSMDFKCSLATRALGGQNALLEMTARPEKRGAVLKARLSRGEETWISAMASLSEDASEGTGKVQSDISSSRLAEFSNAFERLPKFDSRIFAEFSFAGFGDSASVKLTAKNSVSNIRELPEVRGAQINAEVSARKAGGDFFVEEFAAYLFENGSNLLEIKSASPFSFRRGDFSKLPSGKLVTARLANFSPSLLNGLGGMEFSSLPISGAFDLSFDGGNSVVFESQAPVNIARLSVYKGKDAVLKNFNASVSARISARPDASANAEISAKIAGEAASSLSLSANIEHSKAGTRAKITARGSANPILERREWLAAAKADNLEVRASAEVDFNSKRVALESLSAEIFAPGESGTLSAALLRPLEFRLNPFGCDFPAGEILTVKTSDIPFALIKPLLPNVDGESAALSANVFSDPEKRTLSAKVQMRGKSLNVSGGGAPLLRNIGFSIDAAAECARDFSTSKIRVSEFALSDGSTPILTLSGEAALAAGAAEGGTFKVSASIPRVLAQPALSGKLDILSGFLDASGKFGKREAKLDFKISNLKVADAKGGLDVLEGSLSAAFESDLPKWELSGARLSAAAQTHGAHGSSDLSAKIRAGEPIALELNAKTLTAEDVSFFSSLASSRPKDDDQREKIARAKENAKENMRTGRKKIVRPDGLSQTAEQKSESPKADSIAKRDAKAAWDLGRALSADIKIGAFSSAGKIIFSDFHAKAQATPQELSLGKASMKICGADASADFKATFDASAPAPYSVKGAKANVEKFDVSRAFSGDDLPPMTGLFDMALTADASGNNLSHLFQFATFKAGVSSQSGGVIRLIDERSAAGATASAASVALKIAGGILGGKSGGIGGMGELLEIFTSIDYSSVAVSLSRNADTYDFNVDSASIVTPKFLLRSRGGKIYFDPNLHISDMRMSIPVEMLVSNDGLVYLMRKINYCEKPSDVKGYYLGPTFEFSGTPSKPKNNLLDVLLGNKSESRRPLLNIFK